MEERCWINDWRLLKVVGCVMSFRDVIISSQGIRMIRRM